MSLRPVVIEDFPGLDLRSDPEQSGCIDASNVSFQGDGLIATRPGYANLTSSAPAEIATVLGDANSRVLARRPSDGKIRAYDSAGAEVAVSGDTSGTSNFVRFGGTSERIYYGFGLTGANITRFRPASDAFTNVTTTPSGGWLAITPNDNRLAIGNAHTVYFSEPGDPETFGVTDFVDVDPGDGEQIMGMCSWRDLLFVFKRSKFFVFYGTSVDSTGGAVFNFRAVRSRTGIATQNGGSVVAGPDGVYFVSRDGIYRTSGGEPERISKALDPLFGRGPLPAVGVPASRLTFTAGTYANAQIAWHDERLFVPVRVNSGTTPNLMLVWHAPSNKWASWSVSTTALVSLPNGDWFDRQLVACPIGGTHIVTFGAAETNTTDSGSAIVSSYQSGFMDMGAPGVEKTIRETELTGVGTPSFAWARDFTSAETGTAVTLGTSPATRRGRQRRAYRGSVLSWRLTSASGFWQVNRVVPFMRDQRASGERTS